MKVYIGADHRGVKFKAKIIDILEKLHMDVIDVGSFNETVSCDYPRIAYKVSTDVAKSKHNRGILICVSGVGQSMAANKVRGAYAALCHNVEGARLSRLHNNANILVLGAKFVKQNNLSKMIKVWLGTEFEAGRHLRRVNQIKKIEKGLELK